MSDEAGTSFSFRFSLRLTPWLAFGWTAAIAFVWLFQFGAWVWPVQLVQLAGATLPSLRIGPHFSGFWMARLADAVFVSAVFGAAFGVGAILVERLTDERGLLAGLFALAVGTWVVAVLVLIVGAVSTAKVGWVLWLLGTWILPAPRRYVRRVAMRELDGWSMTLLAFIILAALLNLLGAVSPPFEYDELVYHLGAPSEYIKAGRIVALPHNFYSDLPQLTEMLYLLAMVVRSDVAAKLLHWSFGVLTALAVYAVASRLWSRRIAMTAAAMFYCLPFVQELSQTARIDLATTFFATLAFGGLLVAGEDKRLLWLSAVAAGGAVATKWPAVGVVLLPAVVYLLAVRRDGRVAVGYGVLACFCVGPWLVKNWFCTGNPVYPLLNGLFHSPHWSDAQSALFAAKHAPRFDADGLRQFFSLIGQYSFHEPGAVPLLLMTAPLLLLLRDSGQAARRAVGLLVGAYLAWYLLTFRPWRFLLPAWPLAAMVGAYALDRLCSVGPPKVVLRVAVGIVMVFGLARMMMTDLIDVEDYRRLPPKMNLIQYSLGQVSSEEFVARMGGGIFESVVWMNHNLPAAAKVLYVGEARAYYGKSLVRWSTAFDQHPLQAWVRHAVDIGQVLQFMRAGGVTHVFVNYYELDRLSRNYRYLQGVNWPLVEDLLKHHAQIVYEHGPYVVYSLEN